MREREHPLSDRDFGEDPIDQVRRTLCHATAPATRADRPPFAGKRHQPIEAASVAPKTGEPASEQSTPQQPLELLVDEAGQTVTARDMCGVNAERLEVVAHHLIHDTPGWRPGLVANGGAGHASRGREDGARAPGVKSSPDSTDIVPMTRQP